MKREEDDSGTFGERALEEFDRELEALLRVEPSADLAVRVRARLAEAEPSRRPWRIIAPALAAALAVLLLSRALARHPPPPAAGTRQASVDRPPSAPVIEAPRPQAVDRPDAARKRARGGQPEVLVEPGQEEALLRFAARLDERMAARPALLVLSSLDAPLGQPAPIEIAPLEPTPSSGIADAPARSDS